MTFRPYLSPVSRLLGTAALLMAAGCATADVAPAPTANSPAYSALPSLDYSGSQAARESLRLAIADAGKDPARLGSIEVRLVELLGRRDITFAGQQSICESLGRLYASGPAPSPVPPVLIRMLADETRVDLARLALERAPGAAVDDAFVNGLGSATGRVRIALIQSAGNRRISSAVPLLANLLQDPDGATAAAAATALGRIGGQAALAGLAKAPDPSSPVVAEARIRCARILPAAEALPVLTDVRSNSAVPAPLRVSAFLAVLALEPATVSDQVAAVLAGSDLPFKQAVLTDLVALPADAVIPVVSANLKSWDLVTQTAAIAALGRIGDPSALPVVMAAAHSEDRDLRRAAIGALGALPGNPEVARLLADASAEPGETGKLARLSLSRLRGAGVSESVLEGATHMDDPRRAVFLEELALRNAPGASDILLKVRDEPSVASRCAALDGLALVAPADLEPTLISWMTAATDSTEQTHASRAVVGAAERNPDAKARLKLVTDLIDKAPPALQRRFLTVISRTGGPLGADYVAAFALRKDPDLAQAAVSALGQWSDRTALAALATVAEKTQDAGLRKAAIEDSIASMEYHRGWLSTEQKAIVARLRVAAKDAELTHRLDELENPPAS